MSPAPSTRPDPATWIERHDAPPLPSYVDALELDALERGRKHNLAVSVLEDAASRAIRLPLLVAHGQHPGPVVGLTAALHGNELNGIPVIHRLFQTINPKELRGSVVAVVIANMPGYNLNTRKFRDGADLNRIMPGKTDGNESELYAHRLLSRVISRFEYLIDLHTASFGRVNSLYVRADMRKPVTAHLARLVGAQIIVHNAGGDTTLRGAAQGMGIHAITVEVGDPQVFDSSIIRASRVGVRDILEDLGMLEPDAEAAVRDAAECVRSYWLYTDTGGILWVRPSVAQRVKKGEVIAHLVDPWGTRLRTYKAPEDGVVVGKSTNPVAHAGSRILHLGVEGQVGPQGEGEGESA